MADNYLENQYEQYQARKAAWERERKYGKRKRNQRIRIPCRNRRMRKMSCPFRKRRMTTFPTLSIRTMII